jgi:thiamine biosynthesis lipoprotein
VNLWATPCMPRLCLLLLLLAVASARGAEERFVYEKAEMGVPFRLTFYAESEEQAKEAAAAAFEHLEVLNGILSDYDDTSELSRLARSSGTGRAVPVSAVLWKVLERSQELAVRTEGAFDVTVGPLVNLWRRCRRKKELPSPGLLEEMRARVGDRFMRLDPHGRTVELLKPEMRLDVGGIAKGFAADEALAVLARFGITRALIAASGDIVAGDPPPREKGWRVQVATLDQPGAPAPEVLLLANAAASTSGDAYQYVEIDGVRYSHIIDPRTGVGLTDHSLVTVVATDGLTADGLDTAIDVLGPEKGLRLLAQYPEAKARILRAPAGKVEVYKSPGWKSGSHR